jgi:hypothetical protein
MMKSQKRASALKSAIEIYLDDFRGIHGSESIADTMVYIDESGAVIMTYDGAGYDWFSPYGALAHYGSTDKRDDIGTIARNHGFEAQDCNSWKISFDRN